MKVKLKSQSGERRIEGGAGVEFERLTGIGIKSETESGQIVASELTGIESMIEVEIAQRISAQYLKRSVPCWLCTREHTPPSRPERRPPREVTRVAIDFRRGTNKCETGQVVKARDAGVFRKNVEIFVHEVRRHDVKVYHRPISVTALAVVAGRSAGVSRPGQDAPRMSVLPAEAS
ncbi:hypothetical protein EVAR_11452_1 [Eumeta japonica]|uniref:Uncharacterized protein n=1 Tax=Eumeta variegata TaxID=151549 RepID=A0A4C1TM84_EUMVA|nr:hypothetical protein EVAR_11452_1 [Eumeta japonica]